MLTVRARRLILLLAGLTGLVLAGCGGVGTTLALHGFGAQNRVWAFNQAAPTLARPIASQSPCSRPGSQVSGAGFVSGFCVAAKGGARFIASSDGTVTDTLGGSQNAISLGRYPAYLRDAEASGSRAFNIESETFNAMSPAEQELRNRLFLDEAIARGSGIRLASDPFAPANAGSAYESELNYLMSRGYQIDGAGMTPGS